MRFLFHHFLGLPDWAVKKTDFPAPQEISLRFDDKGYPLIEDCLQ